MHHDEHWYTFNFWKERKNVCFFTAEYKVETTDSFMHSYNIYREDTFCQIDSQKLFLFFLRTNFLNFGFTCRSVHIIYIYYLSGTRPNERFVCYYVAESFLFSNYFLRELRKQIEVDGRNIQSKYTDTVFDFDEVPGADRGVVFLRSANFPSAAFHSIWIL